MTSFDPVSNVTMTDAGPPADGIMLLVWTIVSVLVFAYAYVAQSVIAQPAFPGMRDDGTLGTHPAVVAITKRRRWRSWVLRQTFSALWVWLLCDFVHRAFCYAFLSPTMLWRRHLLPLSSGTALGQGEWWNRIRFFIFCGASHPKRSDGYSGLIAYYVLGGCVRDAMGLISSIDSLTELFDSEEIRERSAHAAACHREHQWALPVSGSLSSMVYSTEDERLANLTRYASRKQWEEDVELYHCVAVFGAVTCALVVLTIFRVVVHFTRATPEVTDAEPSDRSETLRDAASGSAVTSAEGSHAIVGRKGESARGEADDSWMNSEEALEEEERMEASAEDGQHSQEKHHTVADHTTQWRQSGMTQTVEECWPVLLACTYAASFAYVGGMPLLTQYVFPPAVILSSALALYFTLTQ